MTHFDTNLLIALIDPAHPHHPMVVSAVAEEGGLGTSAVAWTEFHSKEVPAPGYHALTHALGGGIVPFSTAEAELAGKLYQLPGVGRGQRLDSMIAATAILAGAELATANRRDFERFTPLGLRIWPGSAG